MRKQRTFRMMIAWGALGLAFGQPTLAATLAIGNGPDPGTLDPHKAGGSWEDRVISELFEGLVAEDPQGIAIPGQAESWTVSDDGLVYTFTLRPDAVWSDGTPVTAQHFVDGFRRLFDPATAAEYAYLQFHILNAEAFTAGEETDPEVLGVRALDTRTLEITLTSPTPYFIEALAHFTALPIRQDLIDTFGIGWTEPEHLVGNGPYRLVEWVPGAYLRGVKSSTYYDSANVAIEEVRWESSQDLTAALNRYRAGELDMLTDFPADQYGLLEQLHPGEARVQPYLGLYYFEFNHELAPFDDVRVREALSIALEREVLGRDVLGTGELPAYGWVPPGVANYPADGYRPAWADQPIGERQARARELLAAAGFGRDKPLNVRLSAFISADQRRVGIAVADMWREIGVETELHDSEAVAHFNAMEAGDFEIGTAGWTLDYNDASNTLDLLRGPAAANGGELFWGNNYGHFSNARYDALLEEAAATLDLPRRAELLQEAEALAMDAFAAIPLYWPVSKNVVSPRISGFVDNVENIHRVRWLSKRTDAPPMGR